MKSLTVETHWDCECEENYTHLKALIHCKECDTHSEDQPDSMKAEVDYHD